jgi:transcriptional regulator with XRE-family HTH domain
MYSLEPTPIEVAKSLAARHRQVRKQLKLSQEEMAERSGVSLGTLKRFERTGKISLESLLKLLHLLGRLSELNSLLQPKESIVEVKKLFSF